MDEPDIEYIKKEKIAKREYQINIFKSVKDSNALVILPTGLGKTIIAIFVMAYRVNKGKVIFLAPTKPLCEQHYASIKELTTIDDVYIITGEKARKDKRKEIYEKARVIVATPQTVKNDIEIVPWNDVSLVIFDEVHRCVGNYAYVEIARVCREKGIQMLGLTASPGSEYSKLKEVIEHLAVEKIEVRTEKDRDVMPYIPYRKMKWLLIPMPQEVKILSKKIDVMLREMLQELKKATGIKASRITKKMLIELQKKLQEGSRTGSFYTLISLVSAMIKLYHLKELLTSQGVEAAKNYLDKLEEDKSRAAERIRKHEMFAEIKHRIRGMIYENPKMEVAERILRKHFLEREDARVIVFAEYRDTIDALVKRFNEIEGIRAAKFIGQAGGHGKGMSQDEQKQVIKLFKEGKYNVLVSTSIGEEGIDIPATSLVLFYEPVPSAIRHIQRRGRTARGGMPGEVYILIVKGSRDEAYYWSSRRKEAKMMKQIMRLKEMLERERMKKAKIKKGQAKLDYFV